MGGLVPVWASDDPERDWPVVRMHLAAQWDSYRRYMVEGTTQPTARPVDPDRWRVRGFGHGPGHFFLGTPSEVAAEVQADVNAAPVEVVYVWASLAGMSEEVVRRNVTTVSAELAPLLRGPSRHRRQPGLGVWPT